MATSNVNLQNVVVHKPWGYEYLVYQNDKVAVWYLRIKEGEATSLHCHPRKKTGLILLSGEAVISFLNDSMPLKSPGKLIIRPGLFHSTKAVSSGGIGVLELETPVDKEDLVRFEDSYGREGKAYEGPDKMTPIPEDFVRFSAPEQGKSREYKMDDRLIRLQKLANLSHLPETPAETIIAILDGGLHTKSGDPIAAPGDVGTFASLTRLAEAFQAPEGILLLTVKKEK